MDPVPYYPVNEFGPLMKGLVIGGVGILHVFLAQFAIGGGMLLYHFERVAERGDADARAFVDGYFKVLVLVSFVVGALTGVAMWFTTIQVGARTIGLMVDEFHWLWATEWVWFAIEITAGYAFYRFGSGLNDRRRELGALLSDATVATLVVEHRDRLARFGAGALERALGATGRRLVVVEEREIDDDLAQDMIDLMTCFSARLYGRRSARNRARRAAEVLKVDPDAKVAQA